MEDERLFPAPHKMPSREYFADEYFDYINNYITVAKFGEHRGLNEAEAIQYLDFICRVATNPHPEA